MPRSLVLLIALLGLTTSTLADDCPNEQTAKLGFVLERQGIQAEIRPTKDHFVHARNIYSGSGPQDVIYYRGLIEISRFDEKARRINIPVSDLRSVFPLDRKARRVVSYAPSFPDKVGDLISLELTVTGEEEVQLGPCRYDVLIVRTRSLAADGKVLFEYSDLYAPVLGFVLAKRYDEKAGTQSIVRYQSIKPLGKAPRL